MLVHFKIAFLLFLAALSTAMHSHKAFAQTGSGAVLTFSALDIVTYSDINTHITIGAGPNRLAQLGQDLAVPCSAGASFVSSDDLGNTVTCNYLNVSGDILVEDRYFNKLEIRGNMAQIANSFGENLQVFRTAVVRCSAVRNLLNERTLAYKAAIVARRNALSRLRAAQSRGARSAILSNLTARAVKTRNVLTRATRLQQLAKKELNQCIASGQ